jgi:hypothetical protein
MVMEAEGLDGKALASLSRAVPFMPVSRSFVAKLLGKPREKELDITGRVGVIGEGSNPDLTGV